MTIYGIDISNNQGVVDIAQVKSEGYQFVFAKVSEGSTFKDRYWDLTRRWCAELGLICVGYHYVRTDGAGAQARNFRDNGGGGVVMLDFEDGSGDIGNYWSVVDAFRAIGIRVGLSYIPRWYWSNIGRPDLSNIPGLLISSSYTNYTDDGPGWAPYGGRAPDLWQYTDHQLVAGKAMDANAYRGSADELRAAVGGGTLLVPGLDGIFLP